MKKIFVVLGTLLNQSPEVVEAAFANTDESVAEGMLNNFIAGNKIFTTADYDKHNANLLVDFEKDLLVRAKANKLPPDVYGVVKGTITEMNEKDLAREFGVASYTNLADLISQVKSKGVDKDSAKLLKDIEDLKAENLKISEELKNTDSKYSKEYSSKIIDIERKDALAKLKFKASVEAMPKKQKLFLDSFNANYEVRIEDGKTVVYKDDKPVRNAALEPISLNVIMTGHAAEYGFELESPGSGGRGAETPPGTTGDYAGLTGDQFSEKLKEKNILMGTKEADAEFKLFNEQNPKI